jgi:DNA polymerase I
MRLVTVKPVHSKGGRTVGVGSLVRVQDETAQSMLRDGVARVLTAEENERLMREDAVRSSPNNRAHEPPVRSTSEGSYICITDASQLNRALQVLEGAKTLALDTETTGLDLYEHRPRLMQLMAPEGPAVVIDLWKIPAADLARLRDLLRGPSLKVGHNLKFDLKMLRQAGLPVTGPLFDTMLASQLLDAGIAKKGHSLAELTEKHLGRPLPKELQSSDWTGELTVEQIAYAARDVLCLFELYAILVKDLKAAGLAEVAELEFACLPAVIDMELNGMRLDRSKWETVRRQKEVARGEAARHLQDELSRTGQPAINPNSHQQVLKAFRAMGISVEDTRDGTLVPLADRFPTVDALLRYRKADKALAFLKGLATHINPITDRVHAKYNQLGADTGRFSCSDPNLQATPTDKAIRNCFVPLPGNKLVIGDYSQIELRVAAQITQDDRMIKAFREGQDLHVLTASLITGKPLGDITKEERQQAKAVNFGLAFGMGSKGLARYARTEYGLTMSEEQADTFKRKFFEGYPGLRVWHRKNGVTQPEETRTPSGRRRRWADKAPFTQLLNSPVQGLAADCTKKAFSMLPAALTGTGARLIGTVHDEIIIEAPEGRAKEVAQILKVVMEKAAGAYIRDVPVVADVSITDSWGKNDATVLGEHAGS